MINNDSFNEPEKRLFNTMIQYFIDAEKRELIELSDENGNSNLIPQVKENIKVFNSIKNKVENQFY